MLSQEQIERYAEVLAWALQISRREKLRGGDLVLLRFDIAARELAEAVYELLVRKRLNVVQRLNPTASMERSFFANAGMKQLMARTPGDLEMARSLAGSIHILAPESLTHLMDVEAERIALAVNARKHLRDVLSELEQEGRYGWTICMVPTPALARSAGMRPEEYAGRVARACFLNSAEPVREWRRSLAQVRELQEWLAGLDIAGLHVESGGVDLRILIGDDRRWLGLTGHNIPSFELYVSPDCRSTEGTYYADLPSYRSGKIIARVRLRFREGRVVRCEAETGERFLRDQLQLDEGACRVGEFSLTDRRFSSIDRFMAVTLFDENHGGANGNCHLALGSSYADTFAGAPGDLTAVRRKELGFNDSSLHWDLVNTEPKMVTATLRGGGRKVIYENGQFTC